jgi:hypothetical protein
MRYFIDLIEQALDEKAKPGEIVAQFRPSWARPTNPDCIVYKNPSPAEMRVLTKTDAPRAFLIGDSILVWDTSTALHQTVRDHLRLDKTAVPLMLYGQPRRGIDAMVTDNTDNTPLWHNPMVAEIVRDHPYLRSVFGEVTVSYYDENIVGDWEELDESER